MPPCLPKRLQAMATCSCQSEISTARGLPTPRQPPTFLCHLPCEMGSAATQTLQHLHKTSASRKVVRPCLPAPPGRRTPGNMTKWHFQKCHQVQSQFWVKGFRGNWQHPAGNPNAQAQGYPGNCPMSKSCRLLGDFSQTQPVRPDGAGDRPGTLSIQSLARQVRRQLGALRLRQSCDCKSTIAKLTQSADNQGHCGRVRFHYHAYPGVLCRGCPESGCAPSWH